MLDIVTFGNVSENTSTPPYYFYETAKCMGKQVRAIDALPENYSKVRNLWNLGRVISFKSKGGFQYSNTGVQLLEKNLASQLSGEAILTFSQHLLSDLSFSANRKVFVYVDATLKGFQQGIGLDFPVGADLQSIAIRKEQKLYQSADHLFTRSKWAKESMIAEYGVNPKKVSVVYPGANISFNGAFVAKQYTGEKLRFGFVGKDWKRKGFEYLLSLVEQLNIQGVKSEILAIGYLPEHLANNPLVNYYGFLSKTTESEKFVGLLQSCHFGTLFSDKESLGISNLEFLRCGVPIVGFNHQGIADALNPSFSVAIPFQAEVEKAATQVLERLKEYDSLRKGAENVSPKLTWERAVDEVFQIMEGKSIETFSLC